MKRYEKLEGLLDAHRQKKEEFKQSVQNKQKKDSERVEELNFMKGQMNLRKKLEAKIKREYKKERLAELAKANQQHILHVLKNMHERDHRLKVFFEQTEKNKQKAKEEAFIKK